MLCNFYTQNAFICLFVLSTKMNAKCGDITQNTNSDDCLISQKIYFLSKSVGNYLTVREQQGNGIKTTVYIIYAFYAMPAVVLYFPFSFKMNKYVLTMFKMPKYSDLLQFLYRK